MQPHERNAATGIPLEGRLDRTSHSPPKFTLPRWTCGVNRSLNSPLAKFIGMGREFEVFRLLFTLARGHLWFLPLMAVLALLSSIFEGISLTLFIPLVHALNAGDTPESSSYFLAPLFDSLAAIPIGSRLLAILAAIFAAVLIKSLISYTNMIVLGVVYGRLSHALRSDIFAKIVERPLADSERERSGKLLNILNQETWRATDALNYLFTMITSLTTMVVFSALLLLLSLRLSLIALICLGLIPPLLQLVTRRAKRLSSLGLEANEMLAQRTWTALNGLRIIHAFGRESFEIDRFEKSSRKVRDLFFRMVLLSTTTGPITEVLVTGVVAMLALSVDASHVTVGTLVGFLAILIRLQPRLLSFASAQTNLLGLHASVSEVSNVLGVPAGEAHYQPKQKFGGLCKSLRFENVSFSYPGAPHPTLVDVTFRAPRGSVIAIVGASGAGKSTLLDLIMRFYEPQGGRILVDGTSLDEIDVASWRSYLAVVSQDPYIFNDTVRANILYGRLEATDVEMVKAAELACADDFILELPSGYETVVGERGTQISGGQRQRLALARALIRNPDILILDEATNALDTPTERAFQEALGRFAEERLVFVVAHRLATIERANHVIVLDSGRVVETGDPRILLGANGPFARMFSPKHLMIPSVNYEPGAA
jgi:subfamily B ATP-binding cassette protein MsbA